MASRKHFLCLVVFFLAFSCSLAIAEDIQIRAWLENDNIIIKCEVPPNQPLANALITVYETPSRNFVGTGRSDAAGFYAFPVPDFVRTGNGILIEVESGNGPRKDWTLTAAELYAASSLTAGFDEAENTTQNPPVPNVESAANAQQPASVQAPALLQTPVSGVSAEEVTNIVTRLLEEKLAPLQEELKAEKKASFTWQEMLGGLGWLIGVLGILFYFMSKRKA